MVKTSDSTLNQEAREQQPYHAPELRKHGTVDELTLGASAGGYDDGPPTYGCNNTPPLS